MPEVAAVQRRSPFDGVPASEVVRDVVAAVALLLALPLPWDVLRRGSDLLWVVLATVLALIVVAAPYARRAGVLTGGWLRLAEPSARRWGLAPYALVAVLYLVFDVVRSETAAGSVGPGLALGLAGVVLAAAFPGTRPVVVVAGVVALGAVLTPVLGLVDDAAWTSTVGSLLAAALVLAVLWLTVRRFVRGDDAAGTVLLGLGIAVALELAVLGGALEHRWLESVHGSRFGLFLLPVVAAAALPEVLVRARRHDGEPEREAAARWVRVAVQALEIMIASAAFVGLVALVQLVGGASAGNLVQLVLRLVVGVLVALVAFLARRALLRDPAAGHATAVGAACVVVVLGVVILVARAGVGTASRVDELLLALGLPALVLAALLVPRPVRELVAAGTTAAESSAPQGYAGPDAAGTGSAAESGDAADRSSAATGAITVVAPGGAPAAPGGPATGQGSTDRSAEAWQDAAGPGVDQEPVAPVQQPAPQQPAPQEPAADARPASPSSRWRGTWAAGTDATQQLSPVTDDPARTQVQGIAPVRETRPVARPDATQVLPPVVDAPGARWTAGHALDPATPLADLAVIVQEAPHLRPHVAANPSTYPALLDWLGALGDPAVDAALRSRR